MVPLQSFTTSRLLIVAGKGGVGKTTVTAALARAAAEHGRRVTVVELDGRPGLGEFLGGSAPLTYEPTVIADGLGPQGTGRLAARTIDPASALVDWLGSRGFRGLSRRLVATGVVDVVSTAAPGIDDLLVLGKLKHLEQTSDDDLIVVDGPAAGHALTMLTSPAGLADAIPSGPIPAQAAEILAMLKDPSRCQVVLVTLAEETPINETIETAFHIEDRVGVQLAPVIVNAFDAEGLDVPDPDDPTVRSALGLTEPSAGSALADAARFRRLRSAEQVRQADRLAAALPLRQLRLPMFFTAGLTAEHLADLARLVGSGITS